MLYATGEGTPVLLFSPYSRTRGARVLGETGGLEAGVGMKQRRVLILLLPNDKPQSHRLRCALEAHVSRTIQ